MPPNTSTIKRCLACHEAQPLTAFHKDQRAVDGRRAVCKSCRKAGRHAATEEPVAPPPSLGEDVARYLAGNHYHQILDTPEEDWFITVDGLHKEWLKHRDRFLADWKEPYPPWGWKQFETTPWPGWPPIPTGHQ